MSTALHAAPARPLPGVVDVAQLVVVGGHALLALFVSAGLAQESGRLPAGALLLAVVWSACAVVVWRRGRRAPAAAVLGLTLAALGPLAWPLAQVAAFAVLLATSLRWLDRLHRAASPAPR